MAAPVIQSVSALAGGNIGSTTITMNGVTEGNTLVMIFSQAPHSPSITPVLSVTDSNGAAWTEGVTSTGPDDTNYNGSVSLWYKLVGEAGTHILTIDNTADSVDGYSIHFMEIPPADSFDTGASTRKINAVTTHTANTYTPTQAVLAFAAISVTDDTSNVGLSNPPSGWTSQYVNQDGATTAQFSPIQISLINNATGALAPVWTWTAAHTSWSLVAGFILTPAGPTQTSVPSSDVSAGAWTPSSGASLWEVVDETPYSDADYIVASSNTACVIGMSTPVFPGLGERTLSYRLSGSPEKKILVTYVADGATLATFTHDPAPSSITQYDQSVTAYDVVDWSTLRVGFEVANATSPPSVSAAWGAIGTGANGSTSVIVPYPAGITAGQLLVIVVTSGSTSNSVPTTPTNWTSQGTSVNTTGTFGADTGPRRVTVFTKVAVGNESGNQTVAITGGNTCRGTMHRFTKTNSAYSWDLSATTGNDSTEGTGVSITGAASLAFAAGDLLIIAWAQLVDSSTQTSRSITATGVTFGTLSNRASVAVTTGNDHRHGTDTVPITTGATAAPVFAYTASAATTQAAALFLRIREVPPTEFGRVTWTNFVLPDSAMPPLFVFNQSICFINM